MGSVIRNKNTSQTSAVGNALAGPRVEYFITASRLYLKDVDSPAVVPVLKSAGVTPTGFTDLGIIEGSIKVTYQKNLNKIKAGVDKRLVGVYDDETTGSFEASLTQYDDALLAAVTGLTPYQVQAGSIVRFAIGSESIVKKAIMLVSQNKADGYEVQYYSPSAFLSFSIEEASNAQVVKVTCDLPLWNDGTTDQLFAQTFFHPDLPSGY